jgi:hypothetical protein
MIKITLAVAVLLFGVEALNHNANLKQLAMSKSKIHNKANLKNRVALREDGDEEEEPQILWNEVPEPEVQTVEEWYSSYYNADNYLADEGYDWGVGTVYEEDTEYITEYIPDYEGEID